MSQTSSLTRKSRLGYALGDLGGTLTFTITGSFLTPYYTEVAGLSTAVLTGLYAVLRIWDTVSSPLIGAMLDRSFGSGAAGRPRYRWWMVRAAPAVFVSAVLMFTAPTVSRGLTQLVLVAVTYLLYSISYALFNIPFGSMLSCMTENDLERSQLSSARGAGGLLGSVLPMLLFPWLLKRFPHRLSAVYGGGAAVCAAAGLVCCLLCCRWTQERFAGGAPEKNSALRLADIAVIVRKNLPFDALCLQGFFFMTYQCVCMTLGIYMYRDVLGATGLYSVQSLLTLPLSLLVLSAAPKLCGRFGTERVVLVSQLLAAALYATTFVIVRLHPNPWLYVCLAAVSFAVAGLIMQMQWGLLGTVVEHNETVTGKRLEGTIYGLFNLMRRLGQALGATASVALLGGIGYVPGAPVQTAQAIFGICALVVLLPAGFLLLCWISFKALWRLPADSAE